MILPHPLTEFHICLEGARIAHVQCMERDFSQILKARMLTVDAMQGVVRSRPKLNSRRGPCLHGILVNGTR